MPYILSALIVVDKIPLLAHLTYSGRFGVWSATRASPSQDGYDWTGFLRRLPVLGTVFGNRVFLDDVS